MAYQTPGAGEFVSPNTAESLPAVMSAVTVISEAVASMPCYLYQLKDDGRERVYRHPVDYLLNEMPNRSQTPYQFKYTMMRHCLLNGNAYAVIEWNSKGEPISLTPYEPSAVNIYRKVGGEYIYQITDLDGNTKNYLQDEILHLRHSSLDGFMVVRQLQFAVKPWA